MKDDKGVSIGVLMTCVGYLLARQSKQDGVALEVMHSALSDVFFSERARAVLSEAEISDALVTLDSIYSQAAAFAANMRR